MPNGWRLTWATGLLLTTGCHLWVGDFSNRSGTEAGSVAAIHLEPVDPNSFVACTCGQLVLRLTDAEGEAAELRKDRMVLLTGNEWGTFFSGPSCATPIPQIVFPAGQSDKALYYRHPFAETIALSAEVEGTDLSASVLLVVKRATVSVQPAFAGYGFWNDYVFEDSEGTVWCDPTQTPPLAPCVHAGEQRVVALPPGCGSCAHLTLDVAPAPAVFSWRCDDQGGAGPVTFRSTGFAPPAAGQTRGPGLKDLLDATGTDFLDRSVTIHDNRMGPDEPRVVAQSLAQRWWDNSVSTVSCTTSQNTPLKTRYTIYVVRPTPTDPSCYGLSIDNEGIALVNSAEVALWLTGPQTLVSAKDHPFLWLEGAFAAEPSANESVVAWDNVHQSRIHNVDLTGGTISGLHLTNSTRNRIDHLRVANAGGVDNNGGGIYLKDSSQNVLTHLVVSNVQDGNGLMLDDASNQNILTRILTANNGERGIRIRHNTGNVLSLVTTVNNQNAGIGTWNGQSHVFSQVLSTNNSKSGVFHSGDEASGVPTADGSINCWFAQLFLAHNDDISNSPNGIYLGYVDRFRFFGHLWAGGNGASDCHVSYGTLDVGLCSNQQPGACTLDGENSINCNTSEPVSTALYEPNTLVNGDLTGAIAQDDPQNSSDSQSGQASHGEITDFHQFESWYRSWGLATSTSFPNPTQQGACSSTAPSCQIWDFRVQNDMGDLYQINGAIPKPAPNIKCRDNESNALQLVLPNLAESAGGVHPGFLVNAMELTNDGVGDDDGLCENSERCVYAPHVGAYQGALAGTALSGPCLLTTNNNEESQSFVGNVEEVLLYALPDSVVTPAP